jgi:DNA helicase IV
LVSEISQAKFLDYLVDKENNFEFTDVIIDEGQDFENDWLEYLDYRISNENCFYVFYDQQQCLYSDDLSNWLKNAPCRLTLTVNCRNTEAIAKTAYGSLGKTPNQPNLSGIDGEQPEIISVLEPKSLAKHIDTLVNKYIIETKTDPSNIAIITMASYMNSLLEQMSAFSKLNYADSKQKGKICKTTARKFKGLEADLVIITDIDWNALTEVTYRKLFYTSCSRAKHNLYLVSQELDTIDTDFILKQIQSEDSKRKGKRRFLKLFNLKENEVIRY